MGQLVKFEIIDQVATITLDSQHNRNALSNLLIAELTAAFDSAQQATARVIVLSHDGPSFCSGLDLKERSENSDSYSSQPLATLLQRVMNCELPTIAAVNGAVRAGGVGLVAACDIVVASPHVTFALPEVRLGVAAAVASVPLLRRVQPSRIATALFTGEPFSAEHARQIGLVSHVSADVGHHVAGLCSAILLGTANAIAESKRLLARVPNLDLAEAFDEMCALSDELFRTPEAIALLAAFTLHK